MDKETSKNNPSAGDLDLFWQMVGTTSTPNSGSQKGSSSGSANGVANGNGRQHSDGANAGWNSGYVDANGHFCVNTLMSELGFGAVEKKGTTPRGGSGGENDYDFEDWWNSPSALAAGGQKRGGGAGGEFFGGWDWSAGTNGGSGNAAAGTMMYPTTNSYDNQQPGLSPHPSPKGGPVPHPSPRQGWVLQTNLNKNSGGNTGGGGANEGWWGQDVDWGYWLNGDWTEQSAGGIEPRPDMNGYGGVVDHGAGGTTGGMDHAAARLSSKGGKMMKGRDNAPTKLVMGDYRDAPLKDSRLAAVDTSDFYGKKGPAIPHGKSEWSNGFGKDGGGGKKGPAIPHGKSEWSSNGFGKDGGGGKKGPAGERGKSEWSNGFGKDGGTAKKGPAGERGKSEWSNGFGSGTAKKGPAGERGKSEWSNGFGGGTAKKGSAGERGKSESNGCGKDVGFVGGRSKSKTGPSDDAPAPKKPCGGSLSAFLASQGKLPPPPVPGNKTSCYPPEGIVCSGSRECVAAAPQHRLWGGLGENQETPPASYTDVVQEPPAAPADESCPDVQEEAPAVEAERTSKSSSEGSSDKPFGRVPKSSSEGSSDKPFGVPKSSSEGSSDKSFGVPPVLPLPAEFRARSSAGSGSAAGAVEPPVAAAGALPVSKKHLGSKRSSAKVLLKDSGLEKTVEKTLQPKAAQPKDHLDHSPKDHDQESSSPARRAARPPPPPPGSAVYAVFSGTFAVSKNFAVSKAASSRSVDKNCQQVAQSSEVRARERALARLAAKQAAEQTKNSSAPGEREPETTLALGAQASSSGQAPVVASSSSVVRGPGPQTSTNSSSGPGSSSGAQASTGSSSAAGPQLFPPKKTGGSFGAFVQASGGADGLMRMLGVGGAAMPTSAPPGAPPKASSTNFPGGGGKAFARRPPERGGGLSPSDALADEPAAKRAKIVPENVVGVAAAKALPRRPKMLTKKKKPPSGPPTTLDQLQHVGANPFLSSSTPNPPGEDGAAEHDTPPIHPPKAVPPPEGCPCPIDPSNYRIFPTYNRQFVGAPSVEMGSRANAVGELMPPDWFRYPVVSGEYDGQEAYWNSQTNEMTWDPPEVGLFQSKCSWR